MKRHVVDGLLAAVSLVFALFVCEVGYRLWLSQNLESFNPFHYTPSPNPTVSFQGAPGLWVFNRDYGWDYRPEGYLAGTIRDGKFDNCGWIKSFNSRGNIASEEQDFDNAERRIVLIGSSYTMGNIQGRGFGHLLGDQLSKGLRQQVVVENYGRDSFGVIQMIDMAASLAARIKPDMIVIAFNSATISMPRHWRLVKPVGDGFLTFYQMKYPDPDNLKPSVARAHEYVLADDVTDAWCQRMTQAKDQGDAATLAGDPVVKRLIDRFHVMSKERSSPTISVNLWRLDRSFLYNRLVRRNAFYNMDLFTNTAVLNPLDFDDYGADPGFQASVQKLNASGVPYVLIHIPSYPEIKSGAEWAAAGMAGTPNARELGLIRSLEIRTGQRIHSLLARIGAPRSDAADLAQRAEDPNRDWHPSQKGIEAFVPAMTQVILENLQKHPPGKN